MVFTPLSFSFLDNTRLVNKLSFTGEGCGPSRCCPDVIYKDANGSYNIIEVKTGQANLSNNQKAIFPSIESGEAIPTGENAKGFGLETNISLKDQNGIGIPITIIRFPGVVK